MGKPSTDSTNVEVINPIDVDPFLFRKPTKLEQRYLDRINPLLNAPGINNITDRMYEALMDVPITKSVLFTQVIPTLDIIDFRIETKNLHSISNAVDASYIIHIWLVLRHLHTNKASFFAVPTLKTLKYNRK